MSKEDREDLRRLMRERQTNRESERAQREYDEAAEERKREAALDKAFEKDLEKIVGADYDTIEKVMREALNDPDNPIHHASKDYQKAIKGTRSERRMKKILKKNKGDIKKAVAKDKGCALVLIAVSTAAVLTVWGAAEAFATIMR